MSEPKTKPTGESVKKFIDQFDNDQLKKDCRKLQKLLGEVTGKRPKMWGDRIIGYGSYHYVYPTGNKGDWPIAAFAPGKSNISIYIMSGFSDLKPELKKLGKHKTGKSCLYIKRLDDIDPKALKSILKKSYTYMKKNYDCR